MGKRIDLTGHRYGRYTVIREIGRTNTRKGVFECLCDCGEVKHALGENLRNGHTKSCGCLQIDMTIARFTTHGKKYTPEYKSWEGMIQRCTNPNLKKFNNYGGRGISVCEKWNDFTNFLNDMGKKPSPQYSIDRIDNNGNYEPGNCKWSTPKEQARNRRPREKMTKKETNKRSEAYQE